MVLHSSYHSNLLLSLLLTVEGNSVQCVPLNQGNETVAQNHFLISFQTEYFIK